MRALFAATRRAAPLAQSRVSSRSPRALVLRATSSQAAGPPGLGEPARPTWDVRLLYDGDCPLCLKEVNFLRSRNQANKVVFVDIADPKYDPAENAGVTFERAMATIHGITADGRVYTGVEVFRLVYEAVGLGWVYAITKNPAVLALANGVYDVWARYRTQLTGREALEVLLERRRLEAAGRGSCRTAEAGAGAGAGQKCDL